jgi:multisubunit Na+/H+ antiporter MnhF subunit
MTLAIIILSICIFFMLINLFLAKNLVTRIMSLCCITNYMIVLLCFCSLSEGKESFIDVAYIFGLLGFIVNLSIKKLYNGNNHD